MKDSNEVWQRSKQEKEGSRDELVSALSTLGAAATSSGHLRCPFHDDRHPSASVKQSDGKWFFSCHAASCNVTYDVWDLTGLIEGKDAQQVLKEEKKRVLDEYERKSPRSQVPSPKSAERKKPSGFATAGQCIDFAVGKRIEQGEDLEIVRKHPYTDPDTGVVPVYVCRLIDLSTGKKSYTQAFLNSEGRWTGSKPKDFGLTPLYNRSRIRDAKNVLVVEGEWAVEAFTRLNMEGWAATTTIGGAGKSEYADLSPLSGKNVWLWADNDDYDEKLKRFPGQFHMEQITAKLLSMEPTVAVKRVRIEELDLKAKDDVVDYLKQYKDTDEKIIALKLVFQDAESLNVTRGLKEQLHAIADGSYVNIPFPDAERLSELSKAGYPGSVTLICAEPGSGKTFWVLEKARKQHEAGWKVKVLMLEEDHVYYQRRVLAQMCGLADLSDIDWIKGHSKQALKLFEEHEDRLDSFMRRVEIAPSRPTLKWAAEWVAQAADEGNDEIYVDPITAAANSDKTWLDDHEFLFAAKDAIGRTGARLVLVTHPRLDTKGKPSLAGLAGGAAYPRFSQTVLWLRMLGKPQKSTIDPGDGNIYDVTHEREIQIRKARNGRGAGSNIANMLDRSTLGFVECGEIVNLDGE